MFEMDKDTFGKFLAEQRKAKGYTQKELAAKLFVSDKAVSKWERGLSMPDISLLIPLADILEVSVTELLEGKKLERTSELDAEQVEILVKKALTFSEDTPEKKKERRKKYAVIFGGCVLFTLLEMLVGMWCLSKMGIEARLTNFLIFEGMSLGFGIYFWFFIKERLPAYYDENRINVYSDGVFQMNILGVHFNNSNWPHIVSYLRYWSVITMVIMPLVCILQSVWMTDFWWSFAFQNAVLLLYLLSMFVPLYVIGKKYGDVEVKGRVRGKLKTKVGILAFFAAISLPMLFSVLGIGTFRSGTQIAYVSHGSLREWTASYHFLDGWMSRKIYPKADAYLIEVETKEGTIAMELTDNEGNIIFFESDIQSGSYPVTLSKTTNVKISADGHKGSFSITAEP